MKKMDNLEGQEITITTMSKGYQITVPSKARKALDIGPGVPLEFKVRGDEIVIKRALTHEERVERLFETLGKWREGLSDETKKLIQERAGWTMSQYHEYYDNLPETKQYMKEKYGIQD